MRFGLGAVHGDVGAPQYLLGAGAILRKQRDPDGDPDLMRRVAGVDRGVERLDDAKRDVGGIVRTGDVGRQHRELVAANTRDDVDIAH
ncbi:MAG TPA: hypothetical protein VGD36_09845, partial [Xanthobacteraceae bacterium]